MVLRYLSSAAALTFALMGCQSTSAPPSGTASRLGPFVSVSPGARVSAGESIGSTGEADDCATRLQDLGGTFLTYWNLNKHLPRSLEDLRSVVDPGTELKLSCPDSTAPFVYVPAGLRAAGRNRAILVYDPHLSKDGKRLCLLAEDPRAGAPWSVEVLAVPQSIFTLYRPISN